MNLVLYTNTQVYLEHASKSAIDIHYVKLVIQSQVINFIFSQPPCREVLLELAQNCNKITLPKSIVGPGFPPPHNQDTLISPNHSLNFQTKGLSNIWKKPRMKNLPFLISTISSKEDSHT
ncbi:putative transcription initiation factor TAFII31 [Medicago truncatula]|uniref:Putative transcription initiation factor TAFII31 n=1 Tax=Medicago truncatula TaxID=3880 RepID=A0A396HBS4_MEDTR|nr:putative transcription initiation factor TAFII31 [Medicago truncatula]